MSTEDDFKKLRQVYGERLKDARAAKGMRKRQLEAGPKRVNLLLGHYFKNQPKILEKIEETKALLAWDTLVGSAAANFSRATKVRGNTLIVWVKDPLWMQQLSLLKQELLKRYHRKFPKLGIKDIFFSQSAR